LGRYGVELVSAALLLVVLICLTGPVVAGDSEVVTLSASPSTVTVGAGSSASTTMTIHISGAPRLIINPVIGCVDLPARASCITTPNPLPGFPPTTISDGYEFTLTITASSSTTPGNYAVMVQLTSYSEPTIIQPTLFGISGSVMSSSAGGRLGPSSITILQLSPPPSVTITLIVNPATPIPEYPLGLPVLAIFMIIAYGLIKRRTRSTKNT